MTEEFNKWWNSNTFSTDNPYGQNTPAFWAWEGWRAGVVAEREACAQVCESLENDMVSGKRTKDGDQAALTAAILSERIRARGYK